MTERLHIVEPTLRDNAGHCHSFVGSVCQAADDHPVTVWCAREAEVALPRGVDVQRLFSRRLRRFQALWLYRRLLQQPGRIFVSTASRTDLMLLNWAARGAIAPHRVSLYMHWFRPSEAKRRQLRALARRQPSLTIMAPTASIAQEFLDAGFTDTRVVPYPITPAPMPPAVAGLQQVPFSHLLYAGAARRDKGFGDVVNLVAWLSQSGAEVPVSLQTSADHGTDHDDATRQDLLRLKAIHYPPLRSTDTLPAEDYRHFFVGAICLQLYSQKDFADRISGVTLDALSAGSPIVTLSGTWMARVVAEFDAGVVVDSPDPATVMDAVERIRDRYARYSDNASAAGAALQDRNSASHLVSELMK
jgi:glycosyltransferase involved in cell wall biosynthesis